MITFGLAMAAKLNKSSKQILSILFHLAVLAGMVVTYDAVNAIIETIQVEGGGDAEAASGEDSSFFQRAKNLLKGADPEEKK